MGTSHRRRLLLQRADYELESIDKSCGDLETKTSPSPGYGKAYCDGVAGKDEETRPQSFFPDWFSGAACVSGKEVLHSACPSAARELESQIMKAWCRNLGQLDLG